MSHTMTSSIKGPFKETTAMLKKIENLNFVVSVAKSFGYSLVGIDGKCIYDKNSKLTLALIWQMMRDHTVQVL